MAKIITFANQKGGVANTSSALILGQVLIRTNREVLFVDMDSHGNLSHTLRADQSKGTVFDVLTKMKTVLEVVQKTYTGDLLCSSTSLAGTDKPLDGIGKEFLLKEALDTVADKYAYIIIDPPPALGLLTINTLVASQYLVIPAQADIYSLQGIGQIFLTIESVRKYCNSQLQIAGILITRSNSQTNISRDISQMLEETAVKLKTKVFKSRIRECVAVKEAEAGQVELFSYAPRSNASLDYIEFFKEFYGDLNAAEKQQV
jgi:chromosome partitioning protein